MLNTMFTTDVRQTLDQFRRSVDEMFENFYGQPTQPAARNRDRNWTFSPMLESAWNDNSLNLRAIVPGVADNDVQVSVQNNQLVIEGERKSPEGWEKNVYRQLNYGRFYTAVTLPTGLDVDRIQCHLHAGVLDIHIPVSEAAKPKQIQIQIHDGEPRKSIKA
jgi:HSP20 family protein